MIVKLQTPVIGPGPVLIYNERRSVNFTAPLSELPRPIRLALQDDMKVFWNATEPKPGKLEYQTRAPRQSW